MEDKVKPMLEDKVKQRLEECGLTESQLTKEELDELKEEIKAEEEGIFCA